MTWQIVFYSRVTGDISRKRGYKRRQAAAFDLRENGFAEDSSGVWVAENWLAKIREDSGAISVTPRKWCGKEGGEDGMAQQLTLPRPDRRGGLPTHRQGGGKERDERGQAL